MYYKYIFSCIIFFAILALCRRENHCTGSDTDKSDIKDKKCPQLVDDEKLKKKQQDLLVNAAICLQKQIRDTKEKKQGLLKTEKVQTKTKRHNKVQPRKKMIKQKKDKETTKCKKKKPKRSCAVQMRIDRLKSQCSCGIPTVIPHLVPSDTNKCFNKEQLTVQLLQPQNETFLNNKTEECHNNTEEINLEKCSLVDKQKKTAKESSKGHKGACFYAEATPIKQTKNIGHNRPKQLVNSMIKTKVVKNKHHQDDEEPTGRKGRRKCGPESQQCLCNVNILDCLLGNIPANYLKKLKQQQIEEQKYIKVK